MGDETRITLEDVEIAVRVIEKWLREQERARATLRRLARYVTTSNRPEDKLVDLVLQQTLSKRAEEEGEEIEQELTQEELEILRQKARELLNK